MTRRKKFGWAMLIACPSCAIGFVFVVAAVFGVTAALVKGSLLGVGVIVLAFFWIRNAYRRREETACQLPVSPSSEVAPSPELDT